MSHDFLASPPWTGPGKLTPFFLSKIHKNGPQIHYLSSLKSAILDKALHMIFPKKEAPHEFIIQWPKDSYCMVSTTSNSPIWATNSKTSNFLPQPPSTLEFSTNPAIADRCRYLFTQLATHIISTWNFILLIATFKYLCLKWKTEPKNRTLQWETWCTQEWRMWNTRAGLMHEH